MHTMRKGLFLLLVLGAAATPARSAPPVEIAVVVNTENPMPSLTADDIRSYFMKQKSSWPNGEKIRPVDVEADNAARSLFLSRVLRTTSSDLERHWLEIKYRSAESPPKRMSDDEGVLKYVGAFKGGIGFVDAAAADKAKDRPIRVVFRIKQ
jgi:ABC-type phosphate transport system substrate-binding protein